MLCRLPSDVRSLSFELGDPADPANPYVALVNALISRLSG
jgi:hypothetical protein